MLVQSPLTLYGKNVILRPLDKIHLDELTKLAADKKIWQYAPESLYKPEVFQKKWLDKAIRQQDDKRRVCFVIFQNNKIAGSTSYYDIDTDIKTLNIGYTWFPPAFWGTHLNAVAKLILLNHAFDTLKFNRVVFSVDSENVRSCSALQKLGVKQKEILRDHFVLSNGRVRHSAIFVITRSEWPEIKKQIEMKIKLL